MYKYKYILLFILLNSLSLLGTQNSRTLHFMAPKNEHFSLNINFLKLLKNTFHSEIFVETGTFLGDTAAYASQVFDKVHTIELDLGLYNQAINKFQNNSRVSVYHGNSKSVLNTILPNLKDKKALFYLDAHWSGTGTARGDETTPIITELKLLKFHKITNAIIVIDDIRYFQPKEIVAKYLQIHNDQTAMGFPTLNELKQTILEINKDYKIILYGDILIAYLDNDIIIPNIIKAMEISRTSNLNNEDKEIENAEKIIYQAKDDELEAIHSLMRIRGPELFCLHYKYWYALVLLKAGEINQAIEGIEYLISLGFVNNRILNSLEKIKQKKARL